MKTKILSLLVIFLVIANVGFAQLSTYTLTATSPPSTPIVANPTVITNGPTPLATFTVFVSSVAGLQVGMTVFITNSGTGVLASGTTITAIGASQFTISAAPITAITAGAFIATNLLINQGRDDYGSPESPIGFNFTFAGRSYNSFVANVDGFMTLSNSSSLTAAGAANTVGATTVTVASTTGLVIGQTVYVATATGQFPINTTIVTIPTGTTFTVAPANAISVTIPAGATIRATSVGNRLCQIPGPTATSPSASIAGPMATYTLPLSSTPANNFIVPQATGNCDNNGGGLGAWYVNNMTTTIYYPMIAPFWDDLVTNTNNGRISYVNLAGPSRCVIEFFNMAHWPNYSTTAYTFQVVLYAITNKVEMLYHVEGTNTQSMTATIGMKSVCPGDILSLNKNLAIDNSTNPSKTTETSSNSYPASNSFGASEVSYLWTTVGSSATYLKNDTLCFGGANKAKQLILGSGVCNPIAGSLGPATNSTIIPDATYTNPAGTCLNGGTTLTQDNDVWFYVDVPTATKTLAGYTTGSNLINFTLPTTTGGLIVGMPITGPGIPAGTTITIINSTSQITISNNVTSTFASITVTIGSALNVSTDNISPSTCACSGVGFQIFQSGQAAFSALTCANTLGTIASPSPIFCSDAGGTLDPANSSSGTIYVLSGKRYFIRVEGDGTSKCNFAICAYDKLNDGICDAVTLTPTASCNPQLYTTSGATASVMYNTGVGLLDERIGAMQIITNNQDPVNTSAIKDVWFKFTVPNVVGGSQDWVIETFAGSLLDGCMAIYQRSDDQGAYTIASGAGPDCSDPLSPLGRMGTSIATFPGFVSYNNDKTGLSDQMPRILALGLTLGKTYYVRFWRNVSLLVDGTFSICVYQRPTCGVTVTSGCPDISTVVWTGNPNGNYNGTKCSTPLPALPNDTNGRCYSTFPKIPTIGFGFAPLCGENFNSPKVGLNQAPKENPPDGNAAFAGLASQGFCSTVSGAPSTNYGNFGIGNPIYYRIKIGTSGDLKMEISNQICANGLGVRAALYKVNTTAVSGVSSPPTSPNYDCSVVTQWTAISSKLLGVVNQNFPGGITLARYCNSGTAPISSGTTNPGKFSMTWTMAPADIGNIYYLLIDGVTTNAANVAPTTITGDRCYFDMALTGTPVVLAVKMLSFKGHSSDGDNILNWITASEENNDFYTVERSKDGNDFVSIARTEGAGSSSSIHNYEVTDENPFAGVSYYRLRMTDAAGVNTYSEIIAIYSTSGKMIDFDKVRPNPATGSIFTDFYIQQNATLSIEVKDVSGKLVKTFNSTISAGKNSLETDITDMDNGLYFITVKDIKSGESYTQRFVKQ